MGRLVYALSVSLDGFIETPSRSLEWANIDDELHSFFNEQSRHIRTSLYGRRMYELMTAYWPTAEDDPAATPPMVEFARIWRDIPRVVFSRSLLEVDAGSRLVHGDVVAEVTRLKASGLDMDVGGATLAGTLIRAGLVDEFRLFVHPILLGAGTRFFPPLDDHVELRLEETRMFGSGVIYLRYVLARLAA